MKLEIDDEFTDDIVRGALKDLYKTLKYKKDAAYFSYDEKEEKAELKKMREAIRTVHNWYATVDQYI